jgi:hypothetical protein
METLNHLVNFISDLYERGIQMIIALLTLLYDKHIENYTAIEMPTTFIILFLDVLIFLLAYAFLFSIIKRTWRVIIHRVCSLFNLQSPYMLITKINYGWTTIGGCKTNAPKVIKRIQKWKKKLMSEKEIREYRQL